jgi:hypothetical protein
MHVEPPGHAPRSLKDFSVHYLMIVVGILTAVGIEQAIEAHHHREIAAQARQQIDEELHSNLRNTSESVVDNKKRLAALKETMDALAGDILRKDTSAETFAQRLKSVSVGVITPPLRRDAWDAAIASQALAYVEPAVVRRYSEGYSAAREQSQTMLATFSMGNWPARIQESAVDSRLGHVDQVALMKALATYQLALSATTENERELEEALKAAVAGPAAGGATPH